MIAELASGTTMEVNNDEGLDEVLRDLKPTGRESFVVFNNGDGKVAVIHHSKGRYAFEVVEAQSEQTFVAVDASGKLRRRTNRPWWQFWKRPSHDLFTISQVRETVSTLLWGEPSPNFIRWQRLEA